MNLLQKGQRVKIRWPLSIKSYDLARHEFILTYEKLGEEVRWPASAAPFFMGSPPLSLYLRPSHYLNDYSNLQLPNIIVINNIRHTLFIPPQFGHKDEEHTMFYNTYYLIPENIDFDFDLLKEAEGGFAETWTQEGLLMFEADEFNPVVEQKIIKAHDYEAQYINTLELIVEKIKVNLGSKGCFIDDALDIDVLTNYLYSEPNVSTQVLLRYRINRFYIDIKYLTLKL